MIKKGGITLISGLFDVLGQIVDAFGTFLTNMFEEVIGLFYTPGVGDAPGQITALGTFLLLGLGTGLVIWGFNFIRRLIKVKTN